MAANKSFTVSVLAVVALLGTVYSSPAAANMLPDKNKADIELNECLAGINPDCGVIMAARMMFGNTLPPSEECCTRLLDMGKECHELLVGRLLEHKRYKGTPDDVTRRSSELWEFCGFEKDLYDHGLEAPSPAPASAFSN